MSVFEAKPYPERPPVMCPLPEYRDITSDGHGWRGKVLRLGWPIDDIIVRGDITVQDASTLEPFALAGYELVDPFFDAAPRVPTDHKGILARLGIKSASYSDP